jgi:hypothetical protein
MTTRRGRGDGSIYFDSTRNRYVGQLDVTEPGTLKRTRRKVTAPTRTGVRDKLDKLRRELEATAASGSNATVAAAVADWQAHLPARIKDPTKVALVRRHGERITAELGRIPLKRLQPATLSGCWARWPPTGSRPRPSGAAGRCWPGHSGGPCGMAWSPST